MAKQNLGMVTAYAYAVVGGYEGTEAEFEALLGNIATDLAEIENLTVIANTLPEGSQATASYSDGVLTLGIPKGDTGATGAGATVTVGTTATGDPGTNASVTNSGTTKDAVFNFTIPRGYTGNGIERIELTDTQGAVKTYTILFTDGNATTFDVTDGEVTNATLTAVLADYAKIDGVYESMTVGNAEQLVSTVFVNDEEPYNFRTAGGSADIGDREYDTVVGGTVAWNQLAHNFIDRSETLGITIVADNTNGTISVSGTATSTNNLYFQQNIPLVGGHKYLLAGAKPNSGTHGLQVNGFGAKDTGNGAIISAQTSNNHNFVYGFISGDAIDVTIHPQFFDLTQMFGSTIADYIYSLETANEGAGVAWFRKLFPKPYYAYNAGELMSVNTSAHNTVGFNAWDEEWESGAISTTTGENVSNSNKIRSTNHIKVIPTASYYNYGYAIDVYRYDSNKGYIDHSTVQVGTFIVPPDTHYIRFTRTATTYNNDICINLSWDGERDGEYEEYVKHSYPLDSDLTLRGIPKLDASNNLYYDGDTYESDGSVTRKYGIVDLGTLNWDYSENYNRHSSNVGNVLDMKLPAANIIPNAIISVGKYKIASSNDGWANRATQTAFAIDSTGYIRVYNDGTADGTAYKTAMSGVYLVYELATPTTETADPYTNPQIVNDFGTEEYVDYAMSEGDRDVAIPVGHITKYMNNLRAKLEMAPNSPDGAGDYLVRQTNGISEYVSLASNATIQDIITRLEALEGGGE